MKLENPDPHNKLGEMVFFWHIKSTGKSHNRKPFAYVFIEKQTILSLINLGTLPH